PKRQGTAEGCRERQTNERDLYVVDRVRLVKRGLVVKRLRRLALIRSRQSYRPGGVGDEKQRQQTERRNSHGRHESFSAMPSSIFCFIRRMKRSAIESGKPPARNASCHWRSVKARSRSHAQRTSAGEILSNSTRWRPR